MSDRRQEDSEASKSADWLSRFHGPLLNAVQEAVIATDLSGRILYWNRFAESLYGWTAEEVLGKPIVDFVVPATALIDAEQIMRTLRAGETWSGEIELKRRDNSSFPAHVSDSPIFDQHGELIGIVGISYDITPRREAERKQSLLIRELHHRVKNTLSTVQAIMSTTARSTVSIPEFQESFTGRISALAKTHALLTEDEAQAADLRQMLEAELAAYDHGTGERVALIGPAVMVPSEVAVPLGMAIHELTTNAAKHGALKDADGRVEIRWELVSNGGQALRFEWNEHDGPPVELPTREGFGTKLLSRLLTAQTGAAVRIEFERDGLHVSATVPLTRGTT